MAITDKFKSVIDTVINTCFKDEDEDELYKNFMGDGEVTYPIEENAALKPSFTTTSDELIVSAVRNYIRIGAYADDFVLSQSSWNMLQTIMTHAGELEGTVAYNDAVNTDFASALNEE